jgi:hypothetical protein
MKSNISVIPDIGATKLITIGHSKALEMLFSSDLASCKHFGTTFFCQGRTILKTNFVKDSLGSLYLATTTLINDNCKFRIPDTREKIFNLGNNTWLVYSVGMIATKDVCPKARHFSPLTIKSGQTVTVNAGCHISTMDHIITADETEDVKIHSSWLDWTVTLSQLFDHHDSEQITALIHKLREKITGVFDTCQLLQKIEDSK